MLFFAGLTVTLLGLVHGATIQRGPIGGPEAPLRYDCTDKEGFYTDYMRDCRQFYRCHNGEINVFHCNSHTRFDEAIRACVSDQTFACIEPAESYVVRKVATDFDCSSKQDGYYAAQEDDCKTFHRCSRGIATSHQCIDGTKFDETVNACVLAELATCGGRQSSRGVSHDCSSKQDGYYPSDDDCSKFYRCSRGITTSHQCSDGTKFDPNINACVLAEVARCGSSKARRNQEPQFDCSNEDDGFHANRDEDCRVFHFCHGGKMETYYCADGTKFDDNQRVCMPEAEVRCETRQKRPPSHGPPSWLIFDCENRNDGFYADRYRDCRQFYRCQDQKKSTYFCAPGTQFDESIGTCVHDGTFTCPTANDNRQIKFKRLHSLLQELRQLISKKKHR